ncbi:MAG: multiubiquitin domain-containing protein [Sciscionella sp.]
MTIVVNGEPHDVPKDEITFDEVVALAYPGGPQGPNIIYSVTYRKGPDHKPKGILAEGGSVKVKNGMIFDVRVTDKS